MRHATITGEIMNELNIARILVSKRKEKGITQEELAEFMGVSKASVSKWETAQSYPDITFLPQLASYFNITVDQLISYQPQMSKEDIRKLYHRLCRDFTSRPFEQVADEIRETMKKYYSCFPLMLSIGTLMINHHDLLEGERREEFIREALEIFIRIDSECSQLETCRQAKCMEAVCYTMLNQPSKIVDLLQDSKFPMTNETVLLAQGQMMNGQVDEARETLQIGAYQMLISLIENLLGLWQSADASQAEEVERRILAVSDAFDMEALCPSSMFSVYLNQAHIHLAYGREEEALAALRRYTDLATRDIYPLQLHGDAFFDKIERWLSDLDLGADAPRADATVKAGIVAAVKSNPTFSVLSNNGSYRLIVEALSTLEEEE